MDSIINEATSLADFLERGPLKIKSQYWVEFAYSSRKSDAFQFISVVLYPVAVFTSSVGEPCRRLLTPFQVRISSSILIIYVDLITCDRARCRKTKQRLGHSTCDRRDY